MFSLEQSIVESLSASLQDVLTPEQITLGLEIPRNNDHGDIAFPCQRLAQHYKKSPQKIAEDLVSQITTPQGISTCNALGGYVNFTFENSLLISTVLEDIGSLQERYGSHTFGKGKTVVIDYSAPNLGKPLHVGHIRSTILGDSMIKLLQTCGYTTHSINYLGDIGLHIGKLLAASEIWNKEPTTLHEMQDLYVRFTQAAKEEPKLDERAKEILRSIEEGTHSYERLLSHIRAHSLEAFQKIYDLLDVSFDEVTGQSHFSERGKDIIYNGLSQGLITLAENNNASIEDEGEALVIDLSSVGLPPKAVLRRDGTAIYSTQDIGAAVSRFEEHNFDTMLYLVADEQSLYFKQIFSLLRLLGNEWADRCYHLNFGLIQLPEGRISSREGSVIYLEEVLDKAVAMARTRLSNTELTPSEAESTAHIIGLGAIKYMVLSVDPVKNIMFTWEKALDFNGNSAPYIQYAHARVSRILEKSGAIEGYKAKELYLPQERQLVRRLHQFPSIVEKATKNYKPNLIAQFSYELARDMNAYYNNVHILGSDEEQSRTHLLGSAEKVLTKATSLLGIHLPSRM